VVLRSKTKEGTRSMLLKSSIWWPLRREERGLLKSSIRVVVLRSKTKEGTRSMRLLAC